MRVFEAWRLRLAAADQRPDRQRPGGAVPRRRAPGDLRDAEELLDKAAYYLQHERVRERIAAAGRAEALARHTYRHRMETVLEWRTVTSGRAKPGRDWAPPRATRPLPNGRARRCRRSSRHDSQLPDRTRPVTAITSSAAGAAGADPPRPARARRRLRGRAAGRSAQGAAAGRGRRHRAVCRRGRRPGRLDQVFVGDVERLELDSRPRTFDCVVCGDVLEHLRDPERFLERARDWLSTGGLLVASLPNVRHHSVVTALLEGTGRTNRRGCSTRPTCASSRAATCSPCSSGRVRVTRLRSCPGPGYERVAGPGDAGRGAGGRLHIADMPPEEAEEFFVYQYLLTAGTQHAAGTQSPIEASDEQTREARRPQLALVGAESRRIR